MPRVGNLTFVASTTPAPMFDLDGIPDDIKREAEEVYALLKTANGRVKAEYDTEAEASEFVKLMTSYCNNRPTDVEIIRNLFRPDGKAYEGDPAMVEKITKGGPIKFRKSPVRGEKNDKIVQFRITDVETPNEKKTAEIRQATDKANEFGAKVLEDTEKANAAEKANETPVTAEPKKATVRGRK